MKAGASPTSNTYSLYSSPTHLRGRVPLNAIDLAGRHQYQRGGFVDGLALPSAALAPPQAMPRQPLAPLVGGGHRS